MINVNMTSPDGVTLATNGKYVPDNVQVTPVLEEATVTPSAEQQILVPGEGKVGFGKVTVEAGGAVELPDLFPQYLNFWDYDGRCVYAYTREEAMALTELPPGPEHDGLTFTEWNWALESVTAYAAKYPHATINVGADYITDDLKTRFVLSILTLREITMSFNQSVANGVRIDWGDGSPAVTIAGAGNVTATHTYQASGEYTVVFDPNEDCTLDFQGYVLGNNTAQARTLKRAHFGRVGNGAQLFAYYSQLEAVTNARSSGFYFYKTGLIAAAILKKGMTGTSAYVAESAQGLTFISLPDTVVTISSYSFFQCMGVRFFTIPQGVTTIEPYAIYDAFSLDKITFPDSVLDIGASVFSGRSLREIHMASQTPPTLGSNAFGALPAGCVIYVPAGTLEAYQTATNWAAYADYMKEEVD